ncbi:MAG: ABC transporter ATP-binding protein/permease [Clostridia bacterium]|nr:ABC transporter ATP-binding protein/permease [Clostridia bacterium]
MLKLTDIKKDYVTGDTTVNALKGVTLEFRKSEFVSILGQSGCGKTTLLNIIGGLDQYTSGDLIINGKSTKEFNDRDWDTYRNHSVGFIFQSYNLIPHQSVLANVELALTLSGVSKEERRRRAIEALNTVGLGEQIKKKPNQLSGGQMQRVAIARALVNDPDILLADEPTGALDSETSVQIMELLKAISNDKLIIMVTHNPELAKEYSTRIINLLDGNIISDSNPYVSSEEEENDEELAPVATVLDKKAERAKRRAERLERKRTSMSFKTALSLSLNNLMTKKGRTFLTSFAGSIGIIGIALILAVSAGVNAYITSVEESTMSSYPIEINENTVDTMSLLTTLMQNNGVENPDPETIYSNDVMANVMNSITTGFTTNNLTAFKKFIESDADFKANTTDVKYIYSANLNTYKIMGGIERYRKTLDGITDLLITIGLGDMMGVSENGSFKMGGGAFSELVGDMEYIQSQYDKLYGEFPQNENEVILIVDKNQQVSDFILYTLGIRDTADLEKYIQTRLNKDTSDDYTIPHMQYTFEEICGYEFKVLPDSQKYKVENGKIVERSVDEIKNYLDTDDAITLKVVGIVTPKEASNVIGSIGYTSALMTKVIELSNDNELIELQKENTSVDLLTGLPFSGFAPDCSYIHKFIETNSAQMGNMAAYLDMTDAQLLQAIKKAVVDDPNAKALLTFEFEGGVAPYGGYSIEDIEAVILPAINSVTDPQIKSFALTLYNLSLTGYPIVDENGTITGSIGADPTGNNFIKIINTMLSENSSYTPEQAHLNTLIKLGYVDFDKPTSILIYPKDFDAKEAIKASIEEYNNDQSKENKISYSDAVAALMQSVTTIVDAISYVLIAFVAISLVVSSIMIGIITYISVLERTKEIGILRAIGASKKDISRVFNAETLIVGFAAGVIGILISLIFIVIINIILGALTGLATLKATLPFIAAVALVVISMALTLIAGIFPSRIAAKKDPVIALRSE